MQIKDMLPKHMALCVCAPAESTSLRLKIFRKNLHLSRACLDFDPFLFSKKYNNYLHSIFIIFNIISKWDDSKYLYDMLKLY